MTTEDDGPRRRLSSMESGRDRAASNSLRSPLLADVGEADTAGRVVIKKKKFINSSVCTVGCVAIALVLGCMVGAAGYAAYGMFHEPAYTPSNNAAEESLTAPESAPALVDATITTLKFDLDRYPRALLYVLKCANADESSVVEVEAKTSQMEVKGLLPSSLYSCSYTVKVPEGITPASPSATSKTFPPVPPAEVTGIWITATTQNSVSLQWAAPDNGGTEITEYELQSSSVSDGSEIEECYQTGPSCTGCQKPYAEVSNTWHSTLSTTCAGAAHYMCGYEMWCYDYKCCKKIVNPSSSSAFSKIYTGTEVVYVHAGLSAGEKLAYRVLARNAVGAGAVSDSVAAAASTADAKVPAKPDAPTLKSATPVSLKVGWNVPAHNGAAVTKCRLSTLDPNGTPTVVYEDVYHNYEVTGLAPSTTYKLIVECFNEKGWSEASAPASLATPEAGAPPSCIPVQYVGSGSTWIEVQVYGAEQYDAKLPQTYTLQYKESRGGEADWKTAESGFQIIDDQEKGPGSLNKRVDGLVANKHYNFRAQAVNTKGAGPWSESIEDCCDTALSGKCCSKDRKLMLGAGIDDEYKFTDITRKCGKDSMGSEGGTTTCMQHSVPAMSGQCANCYGKVAACGRGSCWSSCMTNDMSSGCRTCYMEKCRPGLAECTGMALEDLPRERPI